MLSYFQILHLRFFRFYIFCFVLKTNKNLRSVDLDTCIASIGSKCKTLNVKGKIELGGLRQSPISAAGIAAAMFRSSLFGRPYGLAPIVAPPAQRQSKKKKKGIRFQVLGVSGVLAANCYMLILKAFTFTFKIFRFYIFCCVLKTNKNLRSVDLDTCIASMGSKCKRVNVKG